METMKLSSTTKKLVYKAADLHKNGGVFDKSGKVKKTSGLDDLTLQIAKAMAGDIKRHTGSKGKGGTEVYHLYNYAILVKWCNTACCCHYGAYDTRGRASYYLGYHCAQGCMEA